LNAAQSIARRHLESLVFYVSQGNAVAENFDSAARAEIIAALVSEVRRHSSIALRFARFRPVKATFAKELTLGENSDDRLLAMLGYDRDFDLSFLNVKNGPSIFPLGENFLMHVVSVYRFPHIRLAEKRSGIKGCFRILFVS
jgi:hypothetical protein